ncbi:hypothetical protein [Solirubrobacter soli]|uniref:hypothetical protein n=1 Tax=Solirubrobacter soli TaxID=363832 RepID=UPI0003F98304|nr:hypothetical protein [Solirubrobacter soli]
MIRIVVVLACLLGALATPAQASELRVTVLVHGPGKISGALSCESTVGTAQTKNCGTYDVGYKDEASSSAAAFTAMANAAQPNKSSLVSWSCTTVSGANCGGCDQPSTGCQIFGALSKGVNDVIAVATFSDTTAPTISLVLPQYSPTHERSVSFALVANDTVGSSTCTIDNVVSGPCDGSFGLAEGTHTVRARATDPSGNQSAQTSPLTFRILDTALTAGPADVSADRSPTFKYGSVAGVAFQCSLDGASFVACGNKPASGDVAFQVGPLADGQHTFSVRAIDGVYGDHIPAKRTWTVDSTPPVASLDPFSGPGQGSLQAVDAETFAFSLNEAGSTECSVDGGPFSACSSPLTLSGLTPGQHSFSVRGTDGAGNLGASVLRSWVTWFPPTALPGPSVPAAQKLTFALSASGKGTKLKSLRATGVPAGATVTVVCSGKGCPKKRYVKRDAKGTVDLAAFRRLPTTAKLTVTVTLGSAKAVHVLKTRKALAPKIN